MNGNYVSYQSPIGLLYIWEENACISAIQFAYILPEKPKAKEQETPLLKEAIRQLSDYFTGKRQTFDLPLAPKGTAFQQKAWNALLTIPYGKTATYKQMAETINCPKGFRAVGLANNRNPIPIIIPCHRVIGTNGKLVGYAGGLEAKKFLLQIEENN